MCPAEIGANVGQVSIHEPARANNPDLVKISVEPTPLGRPGKPEDIVGPAVFPASDLSAYVTRTIAMADDGYRAI